MSDKPLTVKQKLFISEYLKGFNATKAALKAGYSEDTAHSIGWENLRKPEIKVAIQKYIETEISDSSRILVENIRFWTEMRDNPESSENARLKASEHLAKYNDMFTEHIQHSGDKENPVIVSLEELLNEA